MAAQTYGTLVRLLGDPDASAESVHAAALELRGAFERAEHLVGLLPPDAPEVMVAAFERAAAGGVVQARLVLGDLFDRGAAPGAPFPARDLARSIASYRAADALGSTEGALGWLRVAYFAADESLATAAATRLGELNAETPGEPTILLLLGYYLSQGYGFARDAAASIPFFEAAAERGSAPAAFELSVLPATGTGTAKDAEAGLRWTLRAAELGSDRAQANLGGMYATGNGVERDAAVAVEWYRRAAASGNVRAGFVAGVMLLTGDVGLPVDAAAASTLFDDAEEQGWDVDGSLAGMGLTRP